MYSSLEVQCETEIMVLCYVGFSAIVQSGQADIQTYMHACTHLTLLLRDSLGILLTPAVCELGLHPSFKQGGSAEAMKGRQMKKRRATIHRRADGNRKRNGRSVLTCSRIKKKKREKKEGGRRALAGSNCHCPLRRKERQPHIRGVKKERQKEQEVEG